MNTYFNRNQGLDDKNSIINEGQASSAKNQKQNEGNTASQYAGEYQMSKADKFYINNSNRGGLSSEKINQTLEDPFEYKNNATEQKRPLID